MIIKPRRIALIVIVDGYNLIKQVFHKIKGKLEGQRNQLIKELGYYKNKKASTIDEVILVFDGGFSRHADRQVHNGVVVVFSGNKDSADDWIISFTKKHKNQEMLLVTKDNKLRSACKRYGADPVDVYDFYDIVQNTILEDIEKELKLDNHVQISKHEDDYIHDEQLEGFEHGDSVALDILMAQADLSDFKKDNKRASKDTKEKMSKEDKRVYKKIKKL